MTILYKGFTHDLRSPVQGGAPVWDGRLPYALPTVTVDESSNGCGAGWNACRSGAGVIPIAGLWPNGRPLRLFRLETDSPVIEREKKCRVATATIVAEEDLTPHVRKWTATWAKDLTEEMLGEQMLWVEALGRVGRRDEKAVERGLLEALEARGLKWSLKRYATARAASDARAAWDTRAAWAAWATWNAWAIRATWDARAASDAWAAWAAKDAWAVRDAWDALTLCFAALKGWVQYDPLLLTTGLRDAYAASLEMAIPTGPNELGYVMTKSAK